MLFISNKMVFKKYLTHRVIVYIRFCNMYIKLLAQWLVKHDQLNVKCIYVCVCVYVCV